MVRGEKAALYAASGIPEYWILDLAHGQVEVLRDPGPSPEQPEASEYRNRQIYPSDVDLQPLLVPGPELPISCFFPTGS